jgi:hypothetical protein
MCVIFWDKPINVVAIDRCGIKFWYGNYRPVEIVMNPLVNRSRKNGAVVDGL